MIEGRFRSRVKLFANLLRTATGEKPLKVRIPETTDAVIRLLETFTKRTPYSLKGISEDYRTKLHQLVEEFKIRQSSPSFSALIDFVKEGVFLHVLSKEMKNLPVFLEEDIVEILKALDARETCLKAILEAIQLYEDLTCDSVSSSVINKLASTKKDLLEAAIFLSYILATRCSKNKRELLVVHYQLVRKVVEEFADVINQENLNDDLFERIFRVAIALFLCGYLKSIRLPHEEKIRYIDEMIKSPSLEHVFEEVFDDVARVQVPHTEVKAPLWIFALADIIFIILHWVSEIYLPLELHPLGLQLALPAVPVFLLLALVVSVVIFWRLLYLKRYIIKNLRRGTTD